ncbi:MAG: HDIG domain-containing protein [Candidatus Zixiibacteriota bacterium]|nr:MAG: HDIG domain-containing protein [candidate division Zixibacteria bacterium]
MFSFLLRLNRRIKRLLKVQTESRQVYQPTVRSRSIRALMPVIAALLIAVLYPGETLFDTLDIPRRGEIALEDVIAPFKVTVTKTEREIRQEQDEIRQRMPYVIDYDSNVVAGAIGSLHRFAALVDSVKMNTARDSLPPDSLTGLVAGQFPMLSAETIHWALDSTVNIDTVVQILSRIYLTDIYRIGVLNELSAVPRKANNAVVIRRGDREIRYGREQLLDLAGANARLLTALDRLQAPTKVETGNYYLIGKSFLQPNLWVNMEEYQRRIKEAFDQIVTVKKVVEKGDIIVRRGQEVNADQAEVLRVLAQMLRSQTAESNRLAIYLPVISRVLLILLLFGMLYLFLFYFRRELFRSNPKLLALFLVFGIQLFLMYLVETAGDDLGVSSVYLYPIAMLPVAVTILFDAEVGILSTVVFALMAGVLHRFSFSLVLLTVVIGAVGCFASRTVRKRTHFYRITGLVVLTCIVMVLVLESLKLRPTDELLSEMGLGSLVAALSVLITTFILPVFESFFGFTTDITLLELSDLNHPLLKRLAIEAPGTYHHSIVVANLCEAAAEEIGANALLARVGAYYHDIGKIEIPEYFVENQLGVKSKHESLTPSMSSLILTSHVKKGRQLGEEFSIPDAVLNFIEEHHGTMVMSYFYNKALEQGNEPLSADKFRYPGPKPQIRETAICMLADAVEAASRTLEDPKPARIDNLIRRIINDRFQSGELDECPLTLRDLAGIRKAFAQVLMAAFHHRVTYPTKEEEE